MLRNGAPWIHCVLGGCRKSGGGWTWVGLPYWVGHCNPALALLINPGDVWEREREEAGAGAGPRAVSHSGSTHLSEALLRHAERRLGWQLSLDALPVPQQRQHLLLRVGSSCQLGRGICLPANSPDNGATSRPLSGGNVCMLT